MILHNDKALINKLSIKYSLSADIVEDIIKHSLSSIKECMVMEEMPDILIHNLGRFTISLNIVVRAFRNFLVRHSENRLREDDLDVMRKLLKAYDRVSDEEKKEKKEEYFKVLKIIESEDKKT